LKTFHPEILGSILLAAKEGLANYDKQHSLPSRLADFTHWTSSWAPLFTDRPLEVIEALEGNWQTHKKTSLSADMLSGPLLTLFEEIAPWEGTISELLNELNSIQNDEIKRSKFWPKSASALGSRIERLKPALREEGYHVTKKRTGAKRIIKITYMP